SQLRRRIAMSIWNSGWQRTSAPGIYSSGTSWRIRVRRFDPRTGHRIEKNRIVADVPLDDARALRERLQDELAEQVQEPPRRRVMEFGRYWLKVKRPVIDA